MDAALDEAAAFEDDGPLVVQLHADSSDSSSASSASSASSSSVSTPTDVSEAEGGDRSSDSDDDSEWDSLVEAMQAGDHLGQAGAGGGPAPHGGAAAGHAAGVAFGAGGGGGGGNGGGGNGGGGGGSIVPAGVRLARSRSAQPPHMRASARLRPMSARPAGTSRGCSASASGQQACSCGGGGGGGRPAGAGSGISAGGACTCSCSCIDVRSPRVPEGGDAAGAATAAAAAAGAPWRRRAAFVAGSVSVSASHRRLALPPRPAARDILLPRLPAPALDLVVRALPAATRAALRLCCRQLRGLVDAHTQCLTLRPDRRAADALNRRGAKAFQMFPALRQATLVLAGSHSGASGPSLGGGRGGSVAGAATGQDGAGSAASAGGAGGAGARRLGRAASAGGAGRRAGAGQQGARAQVSPLLPLSGWLVVCGTAECLTSLTLHVGDVALLEDLALSVTHPHLQRLDLSIGRSGMAHATPPVVQFMVGVLQGLRHLRVAWAGPQADAAATSSLAHGPRRLFLDGRPRLGPLLLAALADLPQLSSLELQGFIIDTEGNAVLARHWPLLAPRLRRLVLRGLHLMVPTDMAPGEQLGELLAACGGLQELHADLCLPAALGMMPGGGGGAAAAALLLSLMYAARDVKAVKLELLPTSLTRLCLPGVTVSSREGLEALARLRRLTVLELAGLAAGAGEFLPALQELRLSECGWRQVVDMLPWRPPQPQPQARLALQPPSPGGGADAGPAPAGPAAEEGAGAGAAGTAAADAVQVAGLQLPAAPAPAATAAQRRAPAPLLLPGQNADAGGAAAAGGAGHPPGSAQPSPRPWQAADGAAPQVASPHTPVSAAAAARSPGGSAGGRPAAAALQLLEVVCAERLDDWHAPDRTLLARVARGLLPLVDAGCRVQLKVAPDAQPHIWNESDVDGKPWEPAAVWRHIKAAQNMRRLQAETSALAERLARGRLLQAQRRRDKEHFFVDR
ncbi:hypothetical protein HXX76_012153 [Chlamydomonas incerta]|uniref:F-box domain-containing protein n=1 Tax=Chlamydomonas incerta TaxID=51695 RepID=A0A835SMN4_CHLIN|nr:hypothetical protein HXX76_012153 [Chlamydomonas incerta]|eukprot:KAG2427832.1 hypothetical protein HXX76_012153 [Chlamydomonas incerta]